MEDRYVVPALVTGAILIIGVFACLVYASSRTEATTVHHCTDPEAIERVEEIAESCMREAEWAGQVRECERTARAVVCPLVPAYREPGDAYPTPCSAARTDEQREVCR